jgi:hypothetical protein
VIAAQSHCVPAVTSGAGALKLLYLVIVCEGSAQKRHHCSSSHKALLGVSRNDKGLSRGTFHATGSGLWAGFGINTSEGHHVPNVSRTAGACQGCPSTNQGVGD